MSYIGQDYQKKRIEKHQQFLLKLLHLHIGNYYPLRKWLGISYKGKIDEITHLSIAYNAKYFKKGKKWFKQVTRTYQQPDLGYKLCQVLDKIPQLAFIPALLQPAYGLASLAFFFLTQTTYQPSSKDNYIATADGGENDNYGDYTYLVLHSNVSLGYYRRILLHFDISDLSSSASVSEAVLYLYYYDKGENYTVAQTGYIDRLTRTNWTELGSTWNKYDGTNNWTSVGGDYTTDDEASTTIPTTVGQWLNWTITNIVTYSIENVSEQVHLMVRRNDNGAWSSGSCLFYSKDYTTDTSKRPKLTVTYTVPVSVFFGINF